MHKEILPLLRQLIKLPPIQKVIVLCLIIAFSVPLFLGYYYADVMDDNKALKIELKEERVKNERINNEYISTLAKCEEEKREIQDYHVNKFNEYRDKIEAYNAEKSQQLEKDYKDAIRTITQTRKVIDRTAKNLDKNNKQ